MKKYVIKRIETGGGYLKYDAVDIYLKEDDGHTFVCECGDWNNEQAQETAKNILKLLNNQLKENK